MSSPIEASSDVRQFAHKTREMYEALLAERFEINQAMAILTTFLAASVASGSGR